MKLIIKKDWNGYHVNFISNDFEQEEFLISSNEFDKLKTQANLLDSLLISPQPDRFESDFIHIGASVYDLFLSPLKSYHAAVQKSLSANEPIMIEIHTTDHEIDMIPWELIYTDTFGFLALSHLFQIIRIIDVDWQDKSILFSGPLKILFMACPPEDTGFLLDYEREEEIILNAVSELKRKNKLDIDIAETGTLEELKSLLNKRDYHVVHISSHGLYDERRNSGYLFMEHESGTGRQVNAHELAEVLIGCKSLRLLLLSACQSGIEREPNTGLARILISKGIPMVIGMTSHILDTAATYMTETFYRNLAAKKSVAFSLKMARKEYAEKFKNSFYWAIPALFTHNKDTNLIDWNKPFERIRENEPPVILYGRKIKHLKIGFRGRRRELREHLRILREGTPPVLCITGYGGIGKSTLASRLIDRLQHLDYIVIPLFGEITPYKFIERTLKALVAHKEREHLEYLKGLVDYDAKN